MNKAILASVLGLAINSSCIQATSDGTISAIPQIELNSVFGLPVTYETADAPAHGTESRIDFLTVNKVVPGIQYELSGADYSASERNRSEFGGIARIVESASFYRLTGFVLYVPKTGVTAWKDIGLSCKADNRPGRIVTECTWLSNGAKYRSLYSSERGFELFDRPCKEGAHGICRYSLRGQSGLFSARMMAKMQTLVTKGR